MMGSSKLITQSNYNNHKTIINSHLQYVVIIICVQLISNVLSYGQQSDMHEEHRQMYQRSQNVVGSSSGYYNSESRAYEGNQNSDLANWAARHEAEVGGMAEKLREQYTAALKSGGGGGRTYYSSHSSYTSAGGLPTNCGVCTVLTSSTGKTQEELDQIATEMTNQIIADMRSKKLTRQQINQPNWFENRVAEKVASLNRQHQQEFQTNLLNTANRYHQMTGIDSESQKHDHGYIMGVTNTGLYNRNDEDVQQQQQTVFDSQDSQQMQGQFQRHGNFYQTQNQYSRVYQPVVIGGGYQRTSETTNREEQRTRMTPIIRPIINKHETNVEEREERRQTVYPQPVTSVLQTENQQEQIEKNYTRQVPIIYPTQSNFNREEQTNKTEQTNYFTPIRTVSPIRTGSTSQLSIYDHTASEIVPNYQPRVVIENDHAFETLDQRKLYGQRPITPIIHVDSQQHEVHEEDQQTIQRPIPPQTVTTIEQTQETFEREQPKPVYGGHTTVTNIVVNENQHSHVRPIETQTYITQLTIEEYEERLRRTHDELSRLGYNYLTDSEYNSTIASGGFIHNGYKYIYNTHTGRYEKGDRLELTQNEYRDIQLKLQDLLRRHNFGQLTQQEYNKTITTGVFIHNGQKWNWNSESQRFEEDQITDEEYQQILYRLKEAIKRLGYRKMTEREYNETITHGHFMRGGYEWHFDSETGEVKKIRITQPFEEISQAEYNEIYRRLQETLQRLGYVQMTKYECDESITKGTFSRGGVQWQYNPEYGQWERVELTDAEYRDRLELLRQTFVEIGHKELTDDEYRDVIYKGFFYHGGYRYEYNSETREFEKIDLTEQEYLNRLGRLRHQLQLIGYGVMSEALCNQTISSGVFYYGGFEWNYNHEKGLYVMGNRSDKEPEIVDDNQESTIELDQTRYNTTIDDRDNKGTADNTGDRPKPPKISTNRGDQPPQHIDIDYDDNVDIGIGVVPKAESTTRLPQPIGNLYYTAPLAPYQSESERHKYESHRSQTVYPPPPVQYERTYHRKETSYSQTSNQIPPVIFAPQHNVVHDQTFDDKVEDLRPFTTPEPAYATEVYTVGADIEDKLRLTGYGQAINKNVYDESTGSIAGTSGYNRSQQNSKNFTRDSNWSQSGTFSFNVPQNETNQMTDDTDDQQEQQNDEGQQYEAFDDGQRTEDIGQEIESQNEQRLRHYKRDQYGRHIGQQHIDNGQQTEDLTQQFENVEQQTISSRGQYQQRNRQQIRRYGQQAETIDDGQQTEDLTRQFDDIGQQAISNQRGQQSVSRQYGQISGQTRRYGQQAETFDNGQQTEDLTKQFDDIGQQTEETRQEFGQQSVQSQYEQRNRQQTRRYGQRESTDNGQQTEDLTKQFEGIEQQTVSNQRGQQSGQYGQISRQNRRYGYQAETYDNGQQTEDLTKQFDHIGQQTIANQQNIGQQSVRGQYEHSRQQNRRYEQQTENIDNGQQTENFGQELVRGQYGQQNHYVSQQNRQETIDNGQRTEQAEFTQSSSRQENLGQQHIRGQYGQYGQHIDVVDDGQHSEDLVQHTQDFGQQRESEQRPVGRYSAMRTEQDTVRNSGYNPNHSDDDMQATVQEVTEKPGFWQRIKEKAKNIF